MNQEFYFYHVCISFIYLSLAVCITYLNFDIAIIVYWNLANCYFLVDWFLGNLRALNVKDTSSLWEIIFSFHSVKSESIHFRVYIIIRKKIIYSYSMSDVIQRSLERSTVEIRAKGSTVSIFLMRTWQVKEMAGSSGKSKAPFLIFSKISFLESASKG